METHDGNMIINVTVMSQRRCHLILILKSGILFIKVHIIHNSVVVSVLLLLLRHQPAGGVCQVWFGFKFLTILLIRLMIKGFIWIGLVILRYDNFTILVYEHKSKTIYLTKVIV